MDVRNQILKAGEGGRIMTVKFIKRTNGEIRVMNCRLGVTSHLRGGAQTYDPKSRSLLTVFDMQKGQYRNINLDNVLEINGALLFQSR